MAHAILAPSSASKWTKCPGSAKLCSTIDYQIGLPGAIGTGIHEIVEMELKDRLDGVSLEDYWLGKELDIDNHVFKIEQKHIDCARVYVDYIRKRTEELNGKLLIEEKVCIEEITDQCWGTADAIILGENNRMVVADLKSGKFPVEVQFNYQLMIYALGALARYGDENTKVEMTIIQPLAFHKDGVVRSWDIYATDLVEWGFSVLKEATELALEEDPVFRAGDWCKLCNAKTVCETYKKSIGGNNGK